MWFGDDQEAQRLETEGHERLAAGERGEAHSIGRRLIEMGWSGGFVLEALAFAGAGELGRAIVGLEEGVERASGAWRLWQLLGNMRSDDGDLEGALEAYARALECEGCARIAVHLNRAIALRRAERWGDALAELEPILSLPQPPPDVAEAALALTLECLAAIGRADDAVAMVESALATCDPRDVRRPGLHAQHALALDRADAPEADARGAFEQAIEGGAASPALCALGRRLRPVNTREPCQRLSLVAQGDAPEGSGASGFLRVFDVVAPSPEAGLEMARTFVPSPARATLRLERCAVQEPSPSLEPGVHGASELMLFA